MYNLTCNLMSFIFIPFTKYFFLKNTLISILFGLGLILSTENMYFLISIYNGIDSSIFIKVLSKFFDLDNFTR